MGQYDFKKDLEISKLNEKNITSIYIDLGLMDYFQMAPDGYHPSYDAIFYKGDKSETVELKEDFKHKKTGNLFIETHRQYRDGKRSPSDLTLTTSDKHIFTIHFRDTIKIYEINTLTLAKICIYYKNILKEAATSGENQEFQSVGYLLPFKDYQQYFKYIYEYSN